MLIPWLFANPVFGAHSKAKVLSFNCAPSQFTKFLLPLNSIPWIGQQESSQEHQIQILIQYQRGNQVLPMQIKIATQVFPFQLEKKIQFKRFFFRVTSQILLIS